MKIADSSCLICIFHELNKPFILMNWRKRGYKIIITHEVYDEIQDNRQTRAKINPEIEKSSIQVNDKINKKDFNKLRVRYPILGAGELSIILTALGMNQLKKRYYAVIDDGKARKIASKLGVNLTGTYGLLKALYEKEMINKNIFLECKKLMENSNFRINFQKIK